MKRLIVAAIMLALTLCSYAQKFEFSEFQSGSLTPAMAMGVEEETLGPLELIEWTIEFEVDSKNNMNFICKNSNGEILFDFGEGKNQMFDMFGEDDEDQRFFDIYVFNADDIRTKGNDAEEVASLEFYKDKVDVFIGQKYQNGKTELMRFTAKNDAEKAKHNAVSYVQLMKKLVAIFDEN